MTADKSTNVTVDFDAVVAALEAKRAQFNAAIDTAISSLKLICNTDPASVSGTVTSSSHTSIKPNPNPVIHSATFHNLSVVDAAIKYLRMCGTQKSFADVFDAITKGGVEAAESSAKSLLNRRAKLKIDLVKYGRGMFGLKEWD